MFECPFTKPETAKAALFKPFWAYNKNLKKLLWLKFCVLSISVWKKYYFPLKTVWHWNDIKVKLKTMVWLMERNTLYTGKCANLVIQTSSEIAFTYTEINVRILYVTLLADCCGNTTKAVVVAGPRWSTLGSHKWCYQMRVPMVHLEMRMQAEWWLSWR